MSDKMFIDGLIVVLIIMFISGAYLIHHSHTSDARRMVTLCLAEDHTLTEYWCRMRHGYWGKMK